MSTWLIIILAGCGVFFLIGILGSIFRWAGAVIRTMFSLFGLAAVVVLIIFFVNGGKLLF